MHTVEEYGVLGQVQNSTLVILTTTPFSNYLMTGLGLLGRIGTLGWTTGPRILGQIVVFWWTGLGSPQLNMG